MRPLRQRTTAAALLLVMWAVLFLSLIVLGAITLLNDDIDEQTARSGAFQARLQAESGLAIGSHPQVTPGDPVLTQTDPSNPDAGFTVTLKGENAFLPLPRLLQEQNTAPLERLLTTWGLNAREIRTLTDSLLDWTDPDDFRRLNGAEREYYFPKGIPGPPNAPLRTLDEITVLPGFPRLLQLRPDWADSFTLRSDGRVNLNSADPAILAAITGADPKRCAELIRRRNGPDQKPDTDDDVPFAKIEDALLFLGIPSARHQALIPWLTLTDTTRRIISIGHSGPHTHRITAVTTPGQSSTPSYLEWREQ